LFLEQEEKKMHFFIVPSAIVASYIKAEHQWYLENRRDPNKKTINSMKRFRIGLDNDENSYSMPMPLAKDYENKWVFT
jgi:hypothetical protein